jgi:hypothetical protein
VNTNKRHATLLFVVAAALVLTGAWILTLVLDVWIGGIVYGGTLVALTALVAAMGLRP